MSLIRPIRNEEDYETSLAEIEALWDAEPGTAGLGLPAGVLVQPYRVEVQATRSLGSTPVH